jgi:hypothetical protein
MIKGMVFLSICMVLFEEYDDVEEEMREKNKGNQQQRESESLLPMFPVWMRK